MKRRQKKGVSPVVATVLLVVITFMAVGLVVGIIIPMVRENLGKGKSCFELREYFKILESDYTCYNSTTTKLMVERGNEEFEVKGFVVSILAEGESKRYDVVEGTAEGVKMLTTSGLTGSIEIPKAGEARTYFFDVGGERARISVVQADGSICDPESYNIPACL